MRILLVLGLLFVSTAASGACSGTESATQETLCTPGENIFCRCRGGAPGTKTCKPDGNSFEECVGENGTCQEVVDPTTGSGDTGTTTGDPTTTGAGGGGTGSLALLEPCSADADCKSDLCPMGFCTKDCASYTECVDGQAQGECVRLNGNTVQWCVAYCIDQGDCAAFGPDSRCGFAKTLDGAGLKENTGGFPVCADWGDAVQLPPDGTDCPNDAPWNGDEDTMCHLGFGGAERVCAFGKCTDGCHVDEDCPAGLLCSSTGSLGTCN